MSTHPTSLASSPLLTEQDVADYLNCSLRHVRELWAARRIAGIKVGRFVRFTREAIDDYIERQTIEAIR